MEAATLQRPYAAQDGAVTDVILADGLLYRFEKQLVGSEAYRVEPGASPRLDDIHGYGSPPYLLKPSRKKAL